MPRSEKIRRIALVEAQRYWAFNLPEIAEEVPHDAVQPIGLAYLAAVIRRRDPDAEIKILDLRLLRDDLDALSRTLVAFQPHLVGFRGSSRNAQFFNETIERVRREVPGALLVAGGPHVTAVRERVLREAPLDFAVFGEGELTFPELLDHLEQGGAFGEVPGLIYLGDDGTPVVNQPRDYIQDLDSLPLPAWDLVEHEKYFQLMDFPHLPFFHNARREICFLFTSRACPYRCTFCHNIFGKKFRAESPRKVLQEMEYLYHDHGIRQFSFVDDVFNWDSHRVHQICDLILERGLTVKLDFPNGLRGDIMDEALILKMRAAGMFCCTFALETASPRIQKLTKKRVKIKKLQDIMRFTSAQDVIIRLNVILGFPSETRDEIVKSLEFGLDRSVDLLFIHSLNPFEGTEVAAELHRRNVDFKPFSDKYDYYSITFSVCDVSAEEINKMKNEYNRRFFTPERILRLRQKLMVHRAPAG